MNFEDLKDLAILEGILRRNLCFPFGFLAFYNRPFDPRLKKKVINNVKNI